MLTWETALCVAFAPEAAESPLPVKMTTLRRFLPASSSLLRGELESLQMHCKLMECLPQSFAGQAKPLLLHQG